MLKYLKTIDSASLHVNDILNKWHTSDNDISNYADDNDFVVVSKDADFVNSYFIKQNPKKLIKVSLGNISNAHLIKIFKTYTPTILNLEPYYLNLGFCQKSSKRYKDGKIILAVSVFRKGISIVTGKFHHLKSFLRYLVDILVDKKRPNWVHVQ